MLAMSLLYGYSCWMIFLDCMCASSSDPEIGVQVSELTEKARTDSTCRHGDLDSKFSKPQKCISTVKNIVFYSKNTIFAIYNNIFAFENKKHCCR